MVTHTHHSIDGPAGKIESLVHTPEGAVANACAILCHPLPTAGGSMNNKVIYTLGQAFLSLGITTVKWNTRGTGMSEGSFDQGKGETEDLEAVVQYASQELAAEKIWLAGFSFGSYLAHNLSKQWHFSCRLQQLLLIAPPVDSYDYTVAEQFNFPLLLIQGGQDEVVESSSVDSWYQRSHSSYSPASDYVFMPEASHFFHGLLIDLRQQVSSRILTE